MDSYISQAELRLQPYNLIDNSIDDKYLEVLMTLSKAMVDSLCWQSFDKIGTVESPVEEKVNGTGHDTVFMPKRLVTLVKVKLYVDFDRFDEYDASLFVVKPKYVSWSMFAEDVYNPRAFNTSYFVKGNANVGLVGVWGWETVPAPIKYLQGRLIEKMIKDKSMSQKTASENVGDYSYSNRDTKFPITGDAELDLIIRQYRLWVVYAVA